MLHVQTQRPETALLCRPQTRTHQRPRYTVRSVDLVNCKITWTTSRVATKRSLRFNSDSVKQFRAKRHKFICLIIIKIDGSLRGRLKRNATQNAFLERNSICVFARYRVTQKTYSTRGYLHGERGKISQTREIHAARMSWVDVSCTL